jgi:hypothetical protein
MRYLVYLNIFLFLMICSCFHYSEGLLLKSEKGFIKLTGNLEKVKVLIDDNDPIEITNRKFLIVQVPPGAHTVRAFRGGESLLEKKLFIDNQVTMEVEIP